MSAMTTQFRKPSRSAAGDRPVRLERNYACDGCGAQHRSASRMRSCPDCGEHLAYAVIRRAALASARREFAFPLPSADNGVGTGREMRIKSAIAIAGALAALTVAAAPAGAATLQPVGQFSSPVYVTSDPNDAARLFVVERAGAIRLIANGATTTFMDATTLVHSGGEQGLLSMAFSPDFAQTGRFYVYYTSRPGGDIQIDEFTASGDRADLATRRPILTVPHRDAEEPQRRPAPVRPRRLPVRGTGDGGGGGDTFHNAQNPEALLGKMLRIDPLHPAATALLGSRRQPVRRPRRRRRDLELRPAQPVPLLLRPPDRRPPDRRRRPGRARGGRLRAAAERRPRRQLRLELPRGLHRLLDQRPAVHRRLRVHRADPRLPALGRRLLDHRRVRRPRPSLGDLTGRYVYADYCAGEIRSLVPGLPTATGDRSEGINVSGPSSFGEDACGHIYVVSLNGTVSRFVGDTPSSCSTGGDTTAPPLDVDAKKTQDVDGRIKLQLSAGEAATVAVKLEVSAGGKKVAKAKKTVDLGPGESDSVAFKLDKGERRSAKKADGKLTAKFSARATDASGNRGKPVKASSKLSG